MLLKLNLLLAQFITFLNLFFFAVPSLRSHAYSKLLFRKDVGNLFQSEKLLHSQIWHLMCQNFVSDGTHIIPLWFPFWTHSWKERDFVMLLLQLKVVSLMFIDLFCLPAAHTLRLVIVVSVVKDWSIILKSFYRNCWVNSLTSKQWYFWRMFVSLISRT